jgi:hypothetical protein
MNNMMLALPVTDAFQVSDQIHMQAAERIYCLLLGMLAP